MPIKYRYQIQNGITETMDQSSIPLGVQFESVEYEETEAVFINPVTPRQIRVALIMSGISIASIEAMIDALEEPQKSIVRATWEYSTIFERDNEILNQMAPLIGLSQSQVDDLFILAKTL